MMFYSPLNTIIHGSLFSVYMFTKTYNCPQRAFVCVCMCVGLYSSMCVFVSVESQVCMHVCGYVWECGDLRVCVCMVKVGFHSPMAL